MGCSCVSQCKDPAICIITSSQGFCSWDQWESQSVLCMPRNELFMFLDCNNYRHFITEEEVSQPTISYLLLGKHFIFNSNLLCEVKYNFWTLGSESWPLQSSEATSCISFAFIKALKKFTSDLLWFSDRSPKLSSLLFLLYSAKKLLTDSNIALCIVWISPHFYDSCSQGSLLPYLHCSCFVFLQFFLIALPVAFQQTLFSSLEHSRFIKFPFSRKSHLWFYTFLYFYILL